MNTFSPTAVQVEGAVAMIAGFDYGALDPSIASALQGAANEIRDQLARHLDAIILVGHPFAG